MHQQFANYVYTINKLYTYCKCVNVDQTKRYKEKKGIVNLNEMTSSWTWSTMRIVNPDPQYITIKFMVGYCWVFMTTEFQHALH